MSFKQSHVAKWCPRATWTVSFACALVFSNRATLAAPVSFQQAVSDYNTGKYAQALSEFKSYAASYPSNALVHYYLALCHQGLGHLGDARSEYDWVSKCGDRRLAPMAETGLAALSKTGTRVAYQGSSPAPQSSSSQGKVKKIIEFYADW